MNSAAIGTSRFGRSPILTTMATTVETASATATFVVVGAWTCNTAIPRPTPANTPRMRPSDTSTVPNGSPLSATSGTSAAKIGRCAPSWVAIHQAAVPPIVILIASRSSLTTSRPARMRSAHDCDEHGHDHDHDDRERDPEGRARPLRRIWLRGGRIHFPRRLDLELVVAVDANQI